MARKRWKLKWLIRLIILLAIIFFIAPREPVDREISFDPAAIGPYPDVYLREAEAKVLGITEGTEKRIHWHGAKGAVTPLAIIYIHGYLASSEEIRPVPDQLAAALGANVYFTRLGGHGLPGDQLANATAGDWLEDYAEALAIGRRIGREVLVLTNSTGGTIAALGALDPTTNDRVKGIAFLSPNFGISDPLARLLGWPYARYWLPLFAGSERSFEPRNEMQAKYWTTRYPSAAVFQLGAMVSLAAKEDYSAVKLPALIVYSEADTVVSGAAAQEFAAKWGGPKRVELWSVGEGDDKKSHIIAGEIMSPSRTEPMVALLLDWVSSL